jgi:hypothetical protein
MTWLELDDRILEHPKFIRAVNLGGSDTVHLWLGLRAYCGQHLTDGAIPKDMLSEVRGPLNTKKRAAALAVLINVGLIEETENSFHMHDYLQWSSSRKQVLAARERARQRQAKLRGGHAVTSSETNANTSFIVTERRGVEMELGDGEVQDLPELPEGNNQPVTTRERSRDPKALAKAFRADPLRFGAEVGLVETWPEVKTICAAFEQTWGRKDAPRHGGDPRARVILDRFEEGFSVEQLCRAIRQSRFADYITGNKANQTLMTILRDAAQVDKFCALTAPAAPRLPPKSVLNQPHEANADYETRRALESSRRVRELIELTAPKGRA